MRLEILCCGAKNERSLYEDITQAKEREVSLLFGGHVIFLQQDEPGCRDRIHRVRGSPSDLVTRHEDHGSPSTRVENPCTASQWVRRTR
jgi:hypothetical protein